MLVSKNVGKSSDIKDNKNLKNEITDTLVINKFKAKHYYKQ